MSEFAINPDRLLCLAETVCDENASDNDFVELDAILLTNHASRRRFVDYCRMHATLRLELHAHRATQKAHQQINIGPVIPAVAVSEPDVARGAAPCTIPLSFPTTTIHGTVGFFSSDWPVAYLVATVIFGIGLLIGSLVHVSQPVQVAKQSPVPNRSVVEPKTEIESVGRITGMADCVWPDASMAASKGATIPLGRTYSLRSGLMEITYDTGAKVLLQGPVTYEVESAAGGYLSVGKLTARVEKKVGSALPSANPQSRIPKSLFCVRTPTATVTDLGTEFGVETDKQGATNTHLFSGTVEVQPIADGGKPRETIRLTENESVRVETSADGKAIVRRHVDGSTTFVRSEQLSKLANKSRLTPSHRWKVYSDELRKDPSLVAYYTFELSPDALASVLPNRSAVGGELDGRVVSGEWVAGRLPGKGALCFHGPQSGDRVELPDPNRFEFRGAFSVAVWFKPLRCDKMGSMPKRPQDDIVSTLVAKGTDSWQLYQRTSDGHTGALRFGANTRVPGPGWNRGVVGGTSITADVGPDAKSPWRLAVVVYQPVGKVARKLLYLDGRLDGESEALVPRKYNKEAVWLGANSAHKDREFSGLIDEVAIFSRALSAEEVMAMFHAGNPQNSEK